MNVINFKYVCIIFIMGKTDCAINGMCDSLLNGLHDENSEGALAIRRIFSLVDMITKPKFSNFPNVFKIGLFR